VSQSQCPVCFAPLEVRDVMPCFICGGWQPKGERYFNEWRMPGGLSIVLCHLCELEEFISPGRWGRRLGLRTTPHPLNALEFVRTVSTPTNVKDKYCPECNLRLAFLRIVADSIQPRTNNSLASFSILRVRQHARLHCNPQRFRASIPRGLVG
jgi:hypothetical protein